MSILRKVATPKWIGVLGLLVFLAALGVLAHRVRMVSGSREANPPPAKQGVSRKRDETRAEVVSVGAAVQDNSRKVTSEIQLTFENLRNADLDVDTARTLLERCEREIPNISLRGTLSAAIIKSLCRQGFASDAWPLITLDPGSIRQKELHTFFSLCTSLELSDLSGYLSQLEDPTDRRYALIGLLENRPEAVLQMEPSELFGSSKEEQLGVINGLSGAFSQIRSEEARIPLFDRLVQLTATGTIAPASFLNIVNSAPKTDPFADWSIVKGYSSQFEAKSLEEVQQGLVRNMIPANPSQAMDLICSDPGSKYSYPILSAAINKFYELSPKEANTWITDNLDRIDPATSQRVISVVAQVANRYNEFETSRNWANQILNAEVRQQLLEQLDEREAAKDTPPSQ